MLAKAKSLGLNGVKGYIVDVEVDIHAGTSAFETVGLPDAAIKESKQRVPSAVSNSGFHFPYDRVVVNLAPADTKKEGAYYDLPIALAILAASEQIPVAVLNGWVFVGELSLDGGLNRVNGVLPILISAVEQGYKRFIIPKENAKEASFLEGAEVYALASLRQTVAFLKGEIALPAVKPSTYADALAERKTACDFADVSGQAVAKRAVEIAVSGGHNILLIGAPGSGKTMMSKSIISIMPDMSFEEALEVTKIHSVAGELDTSAGIVYERPFRSPHHTATIPALVGGGKNAKPGEISLAHGGVLFLDEMPEYSRHSLETLRQPLEDGVVTIARAVATIEYPAKFMLVASMNPCPCGNYGSKTRECRCSASQIRKYVNKLSGPLLDRIDLHVEVDAVSFEDLRSAKKEESSAVIKERVNRARAVQEARYKGTGRHSNAEMDAADLKRFCEIDADCERLLKEAFDKLKMSARAYTRVLKVARTIADMAGEEKIRKEHLIEAIGYRTLDRKYWN